ncbi:MAG: transporter [Bacillota bacterium]|jgi:PPP family 3-phenylpropionic acid transporter|nr:transporter [Bacillota bacterium]
MKTKYYSFVGIYLFTFAGLGTLLPLLGQYMASLGFSGVQIGIVTSAGTAVGIGASPFWGYRSHHSKDSTKVLLFLCISATVIILGAALVKQYILFLFTYMAFTFFQTAIMPLTDAMAIKEQINFGSVRKYGSIGFALGVFVAGQAADAAGLVIILPFCAMGYTAAWIIMIRLRLSRKKSTGKADFKNIDGAIADNQISSIKASPALNPAGEASAEKKKGKNRASYFMLFKNKKYMALLLSAFFICGTNVANNTYFGFLYKDVGGSIAGIGTAFLLMCSSEAPFMAWTERLSRRFGMEKLILFSLIMSALRYLWYSTGPAPGLLIGTFFVQGMVTGIVLVELVRYLNCLVDRAIIGMSMALYYAFSSNFSSIVCHLIGGTILDHYSGAQVYLFFSIYNIIGILVFVGFGLHKKNRNDGRKE